MASGVWEVEVPGRQGRLVFARLALAAGPVERDDLADLIWPDHLPPAWERDLSAVVSKLRRLLRHPSDGARGAIKGATGCYELVLPPGSTVDVIEAAGAVDRARGELGHGRLDEARLAAEEAAAVARRPLLPGTSAVWLDERRHWLRGVLVAALAVQVEVAIRRHDPAGVRAANEAVAADPTSEPAYANQMRLYLALGQAAAALMTYQRYRAAVVDDLGLPAAPELEALLVAARAGSANLPSPGPVSEPPSGRGGLLPRPATTFVGRDPDLVAVDAALQQAKIVTITGPAGVGKSRLALEAARRVAGRYRDGVRSCELAHVAHPEAVVPALAAAVGVSSETGVEVEDSLVDALASRRLLLVVDNCEHVLPMIVPVVEAVVAHCVQVRVLATSRERLAADGEAVVRLGPLELPERGGDPHTAWAQPTPALRLLRDRVEAVRPGFAPKPAERDILIDICRRLDGLPLAIELAAARMATMGPGEVARRLDRRLAILTRGRRTAPARHQTLRAAIEWSYNLLDRPERLVFEGASVFSGGLTLDAAEAMWAAGSASGDEVVDVITALVDKSLLALDARRAVPRYVMLDTLREFARERLTARGEAARATVAHADHFAAFACEAAPHIQGPAEGEWVARLDAETANFRVAHESARRAHRADLAGAMSASLVWFAFWRMRAEVLSWAERLADGVEMGATAVRVGALAAAGRGAWMRGDLKRSAVLAGRAVAAAEGDPVGRLGWHVLGDVGLFSGRLDRAQVAYEQADRLAEAAADVYHSALLRGCRALVRVYAGDPVRAAAVAADSRAAGRECGNPTALAWSDYVTGETLLSADPDRALVHLDQAAALAEPVSNEFVQGVAGLSAVSLRARHGDPAASARAFVEIIDRWERGGNWRQQWTTMRQAAELLLRLERPQAAGVVLGAIEGTDAENVYGKDAERLTGLHEELRTRLGRGLDRSIDDGRELDRADVVAFVRAELVAAGDPDGATIRQTIGNTRSLPSPG